MAVSSLLGRLVPPALRGRIFSLLYTLQHVSVLGGSAAVGLLASVWGAWPLIVMALAFTFLFLTLHLMAIRNEILRRRIARVTMLAAAEGDRLAPSLATEGA